MGNTKSVRLTDFTLDELRQLQNQVEQEIKRRSARQKKDVLNKIKALAASSGFSLDEILTQGGSAEKLPVGVRSVAPKYRNPLDHSVTWTGRGKQPRWVGDALASGKTLGDLLIAP